MEFQHELVIPDEGMPFKLFPFEGGNGNYVREKHWHTPIEIFAVMEGELEFTINENEFLLSSGELIIINSNEVHAIKAFEANHTAVLQIPLEQFEPYYTADRFIRFGMAEQENRQKIFNIISQLSREYVQKEVGWEYKSISLYHEILWELVRDFRIRKVGESEIRQNRRLDDLSQITDYMTRHYKEDLTLSNMAERFGYSDAYLSRMFRKYAKINFKSYLQDLRSVYAYRDLVNTDHTISRIAMDNGFCSSRGLAKDFQKRFGALPSDIRKEQKVKKLQRFRQEI